MVFKEGVILIKDNLITRNWNGDRYCSFFSCEESINHLFLHCWYAKFLWRAIHIVFGISPPTTMNEMFSSWVKHGGPKPNLYLVTGVPAFCWMLWLFRNEVVFGKCRPKTFFAGTIQRNVLALILGQVAAKWEQWGAHHFSMSNFGDSIFTFL